MGSLQRFDRIVSMDVTYDPEMREIKCSRYYPNLAKLSLDRRRILNEWLIKYEEILFQLCSNARRPQLIN